MEKSKTPFLFDFGLSQEDPLTEQFILGICPGDCILSLASGGDVPLSLLSMNENIRIVSVDISEAQIKLCRLKLLSAIHLHYPLNGRFLGFATEEESVRRQVYLKKIRPLLSSGDALFWDQNMRFVEKGIINGGRFEKYITQIRYVAWLFIGKKNLQRLISSTSAEEQNIIFDKYIATRRSLRLLFKIAFHPAIYKKRGLQEQALIHANKSTGERFYGKFRDFCTINLAAENYFLQYFLTGSSVTSSAFPHYLKPENRNLLIKNSDRIEFSTKSVQKALSESKKGFFNKIHLSNLGDWSDTKQFEDLAELIKNYCDPGTKICYRYLQKNHLLSYGKNIFIINCENSDQAEKNDRFPFYGIVQLILK